MKIFPKTRLLSARYCPFRTFIGFTETPMEAGSRLAASPMMIPDTTYMNIQIGEKLTLIGTSLFTNEFA